MKKARLEEDSKISEIAKAQYGESFCEKFSYSRAGGSGTRVLVRPNAIARRYRTMKIGHIPSSETDFSLQ
jgi:hypothetical protein